MLQRTIHFLAYAWILSREVVLATISVVKVVLGPMGRVRSGFVAMPLAAETDLEVTALANSITLTPGTITVHVDPAYDFLVMHAIDIGTDPEDLRRTTKEVLEANILRWTRPSGATGGKAS